MKIFVVGDWVTGTGPANVTKYYIENLPKGTLFQKRKSKLARVPEIVFKTILADVILYSGYSGQNVLGMRVAKLFKKPTAYLMHGCVEHENAINLEVDEKMNRIERLTLEYADKIYAVSPSFAEYLRCNYCEYSDKIDYITNAIDDELIQNSIGLSSEDSDDVSSYYSTRNCHNVMSIGGGMPRKKIINICEAINILRDTYDDKMTLTVIGAVGADSEAINAYDFVYNMGKVSFEKCVELLRLTGLFVQNSCFETFGLAVVEALSCGSSVLFSKEVGAKCLISNATSDDVINDYNNPQEIADKIRNLIDNPNNNRLRSGIEWENNSWKARSKTLQRKLSELVR